MKQLLLRKMATSLRKYKYKPGSSNETKSASSTVASNSTSMLTGPETPAEPLSDSGEVLSGLHKQPDLEELKVELLASIKAEMTELFQREVTKVIANEIEGVKSELQSVKLEIANNTGAIRAELDTVKTTVADMERGLSGCSDDIVELQTKVQNLEKTVTALQEKCVDMEGRMRRSNIRILNVAEESSCAPSAVSKLLKEVLKLDKDVMVDRSHRTLQDKRADGRPRAIIAKLHYFQDCVAILRRVREAGPLCYNGSSIFIFPDYAPTVARARLAFNDAKVLLRGRPGVRYGLLYPARLRITHNNGKEATFDNPVEAKRYIQENIV